MSGLAWVLLSAGVAVVMAIAVTLAVRTRRSGSPRLVERDLARPGRDPSPPRRLPFGKRRPDPRSNGHVKQDGNNPLR